MRFGGVTSGSEVLTLVETSPTVADPVTVTVPSAARKDVIYFTANIDLTINASGAPPRGAEIVFFITNDGVLPRTITFGSGFSSTGPIVGVLDELAVAKFESDGTAYREIGRNTGF